MDELTAFLTARLDEDERYLNSNKHHLWTSRPLREVAAKRAILADLIRRADRLQVEFSDTWFPKIIHPLAAVWSDHPDYRQEWAPGPEISDTGAPAAHESGKALPPSRGKGL